MLSNIPFAAHKEGLKQWELATRANMRPSRLSRIIRGREIPTAEEKQRITRELRHYSERFLFSEPDQARLETAVSGHGVPAG